MSQAPRRNRGRRSDRRPDDATARSRAARRAERPRRPPDPRRRPVRRVEPALDGVDVAPSQQVDLRHDDQVGAGELTHDLAADVPVGRQRRGPSRRRPARSRHPARTAAPSPTPRPPPGRRRHSPRRRRGRASAVGHEPRQRLLQPVADRAAHAAVRQAHDAARRRRRRRQPVRRRCRSMPKSLTITPIRRPPGSTQQLVDQRGLARPEVAADARSAGSARGRCAHRTVGRRQSDLGRSAGHEAAGDERIVDDARQVAGLARILAR